MKKVLMIHADRCTGCRICELACSWQHELEFNPDRSRINVISWKRDGVDFPLTCQQCDNAPCARVCPVEAISYRAGEQEAWVVDESKCIGCRSCAHACPYGVIAYHPERHVALKCDHCEGDPSCVKRCPMGVLEWVPAERLRRAKGRDVALRLLDAAGQADPVASGVADATTEVRNG